MLGIPSNTRAQATLIWRFLSSKLARFLCATAIVLALALLWFEHYDDLNLRHGPSITTNDLHALPDATDGQLHLLIPATSTNVNLCKLLLSSQILGYPTPVLINYGDLEDLDEYVQHLAKVEGILNYLEALDASDEKHLILIIDGFDVWLQLRPDVLLKRYFNLNAAADARNRRIYGDQAFEEHEMRQTVIFSQDKVCWPMDFARPACWAVPGGTLPSSALGPDTDALGFDMGEFNSASWLNSGSIIGPAEDLRDIFRATLEEIRANHTTDSDQFYFANVFGNQEYARLSTNAELLNTKKEHISSRMGGEVEFFEPDVTEERKFEYHVGIDYVSHLFQTAAFWKQTLTFTRGTDAWTSPTGKTYGLQLPSDVSSSVPPFAALSGRDQKSWSEVQLHYNPITSQVPVLLHMTGEKQFREIWWGKLWFQSRAQDLHEAIRKYDQRVISPEPIGNVHWRAAEPDDAADIAMGGKMGAYTDRRGWMSWKGLCRPVEEEIFATGLDDEGRFDHAVLVPEDDKE